VSPREDYEEEAAEVLRHLRTAVVPVRTVLELGSGGGHLASWLTGLLELTLVDRSPAMVAVSTARNPGCEHAIGDMRTVRLGRQFDAVLIHDAVDYLCTETDLSAAFRTAFEHCRPGGILVVLPDHTTETFEPATDHGGSDGPDGRAVRFLEWTTDPDPTDTTVRTDYVFVLRDGDGTVRLAHDVHVLGLFPEQTWLRLLHDTGFRAEAERERTTEDRTPRTVFRGHRPAS
jgi:SAM-dependent methyltransferase